MSKEDLVRKFAPEVRLHSTDPHFPTSVEWFLQRSELIYGAKQDDPKTWRVVLSPAGDALRLISQKVVINGEPLYTDMLKMRNDKPRNFFLALLRKAYREGEKGNTEQVPAYVHLVEHVEGEGQRPDEEWIDIQYWFFYAFNGPVVAALPTAGIHEGDWEHCTVRVSRKKRPAPRNDEELKNRSYDGFRIKAVYTERHAIEGKWYLVEASSPTTDDGFKLTMNTHPIIYSAIGGHACYATPGTQKRTVTHGLIDDHADGKGVVWQTWKKFVIMPEPSDWLELQRTGTYWVRFVGAWGRPAGGRLESGGPIAPPMKDSWRNSDDRMTSKNTIYPHSHLGKKKIK
jgi:hypothetical protein